MSHSCWEVLHRYVSPIDPDYGGAPFRLTLWLDNLGGLVLGMDVGDGAKVIAQPLPRREAEALAAALRPAPPVTDTEAGRDA